MYGDARLERRSPGVRLSRSDARRFALAGLCAGIGYLVFFFLIDVFGQTWDRYRDLEADGRLLDTSRLGGDTVYWLVLLSTVLLYGFAISWLYVRAQRQPGRDWRTALVVGVLVGFVGTFLVDFNIAATFIGFPYQFTFWAGVETWGGAIVASLVAATVYGAPAGEATPIRG